MIEAFNYKLNEICNALNSENFKDNYLVRGITWDSRDKGENHCFVCIKGKNFDGYD